MTDSIDTSTEASPLEQSRKYIQQLKDIEFHTRDYLEKLAAMELTVEDQLKQKENAQEIGEIFSHLSHAKEHLTDFVEKWEMECNRKAQAMEVPAPQ